ncbi:MAG: hypothetical protein U0R50_07675 [Gaiellales bacterium]
MIGLRSRTPAVAEHRLLRDGHQRVATRRRPRTGWRRWVVTLAATAISTYALDAFATAVGVALVASDLFAGLEHRVLYGVLATTYVLWGLGLRVNLVANGDLLEQTGTSTSAPSKLLYDLAARGSSNTHRARRRRRRAAALGYIATELAKELPYYAGAFGVAAASDWVDSSAAIVFLAGTNVGAAIYEAAVGAATRLLLRGALARPVPARATRR